MQTETTSILAAFTCRSVAHVDGLENMCCPLCGTVVRQLDLQHYYERGSDRQIECCADCLEAFEADSCAEIDSDTLDPEVFSRFWEHAQEQMALRRKQQGAEQELSDVHAALVAEGLDAKVRYIGQRRHVVVERADGQLFAINIHSAALYPDERALQENTPAIIIRIK